MGQANELGTRPIRPFPGVPRGLRQSIGPSRRLEELALTRRRSAAFPGEDLGHPAPAHGGHRGVGTEYQVVPDPGQDRLLQPELGPALLPCRAAGPGRRGPPSPGPRPSQGGPSPSGPAPDPSRCRKEGKTTGQHPGSLPSIPLDQDLAPDRSPGDPPRFPKGPRPPGLRPALPGLPGRGPGSIGPGPPGPPAGSATRPSRSRPVQRVPVTTVPAPLIVNTRSMGRRTTSSAPFSSAPAPGRPGLPQAPADPHR